MLSRRTMLLKKSRRIPIPDVPPPTRREFDKDHLVIAITGALSAAVLIGALWFVFLDN